MNNSENIVPSLLSSPTCSYLWNRPCFSSIIGCSPVELVLLTRVHHAFAFLVAIPAANPTAGLQRFQKLCWNTKYNKLRCYYRIDQPGPYTLYPVGHLSSSTSVVGHWQGCNTPTLAPSAGTRVVAAVVREQPCSHSPLIAAPSLAWHPSSHGTVTQLEFGGRFDSSELPKGAEKAFKLCIQVFLKKQRPFFFSHIYLNAEWYVYWGREEKRTLRRIRLNATENLT